MNKSICMMYIHILDRSSTHFCMYSNMVSDGHSMGAPQGDGGNREVWRTRLKCSWNFARAESTLQTHARPAMVAEAMARTEDPRCIVPLAGRPAGAGVGIGVRVISGLVTPEHFASSFAATQSCSVFIVVASKPMSESPVASAIFHIITSDCIVHFDSDWTLWDIPSEASTHSFDSSHAHSLTSLQPSDDS